MKYKVGLEVDGIELFATVMKLVEGNRGIRVTCSEMVLQDAGPKSVVSRKRSGSGAFQHEFYAYWSQPGHADGFITADAVAWCKANGFSVTSASSLTTMLVREGLAERLGKGSFKLLRKTT